MSSLLASALRLRRDPRILKLPPYVSLACVVVGVAWLFLLPVSGNSRRTYISENALLPGQVHTYFSGSDQNVFRAYKNEVVSLENQDNYEVNDRLEAILKGIGLKVARQNYTYHAAGQTYSGQNVYSILQAPRGDATEAIVLVAAWRNMKDELNKQGVPLALTLARYFKRWSLWSKDIIFVFPPDSRTGTQAWVDAYHDSHDSSLVSSLPLKSGALQGAIAIDYPQDERFKAVHIVYDGVNGQLPNLDLINSIGNIASGQMGFQTTFQEMWSHSDNYQDRLRTMLRGMINQGFGHATGPHSSFIPYHVDAVTLQPYGDGWQDEMALGRLVEGSFRSLNNLLEHLHQSFFFYLLMHKDRFVSIGTYLPSAMLLAANFTIMAISLWVKSTQPDGPATPGQPPASVKRHIVLPLTIVVSCQALGAIPLYLFNHAPADFLAPVFMAFTGIACALPHIISRILTTYYRPTAQQYKLMKSFTLLLLGMFLSTLATLNFSLAFIVGLFSSALSFMQPFPNKPTLKWLEVAFLTLVAPTTLLYSAASYWDTSLAGILEEAAFGWHVWGMYTPIVAWCVWWPAWLSISIIVLGEPSSGSNPVTTQGKSEKKESR